MPIARRLRTSRSRSSIRWERKVSWPSCAAGSLTSSARRLVARRAQGGRLLDAELELRRRPGRRGCRWLVGGLRAGVDRALERGLRLANLVLGIGDLGLDVGLERARGAFELG